ncbi:phosphate acyltransferase PlsX [Planococcaceae bacterium Storch 2/2-2]|nr:phosphate acyltransferase PlsX [Planococcaceae bacterium Storch 2/2-2]
MRLAIDAMGGDNAPQAIIDGALRSLHTFPNLHIDLYGDEAVLAAHMKQHARMNVIHCTEVIEGEDEPVRAVRRKKDASMVRAAQAVKDGEADAALSAGNTGALMAAGLFIVGRIKGIDRPALAPTLPTMDRQGFVFLDVGANADAKANHLYQNAVMGSIYAQHVRGIVRPRVGLLNIGTEEGKGNEVTKETYELIKADDRIHFVGNIESRDLLNSVADVIVTDGFTGNMVLKTLEGTALSMFSVLKDVFMKSAKTKMAALLVKNDLKEMKTLLDYTEYGGAALFGLNAPVVKAHGSSNEKAIFNAIRQAVTMVEHDVSEVIRSTIQGE